MLWPAGCKTHNSVNIDKRSPGELLMIPAIPPLPCTPPCLLLTHMLTMLPHLIWLLPKKLNKCKGNAKLLKDKVLCKGVHSLMPDLGRCCLVMDRWWLRPGFHQRYRLTRWEEGIERVWNEPRSDSEEHQVGDLVFAQVNYLYIQLKATPACVIVPIAKVPRTKYRSYQ